MISLNISPEGEITISQETPGERRFMSEHYARQEKVVINNFAGESAEQDMLDSGETERDEMKAAFFRSGWDAAIRETQLNYVNGRIEEFFNELVPVPEDVDPHHNEPEGTGEAFDGVIKPGGWPYEGDEMPHDEEDDPAIVRLNKIRKNIRKVADSGEPEKEDAEVDTECINGVWTIGNEELQALKDAEFERGVNYVSPTVGARYTDEQIKAIRGSLGKIHFSAIRGAFDRAVAAAENGVTPNTDRTGTILNMLFSDLGFEVV